MGPTFCITSLPFRYWGCWTACRMAVSMCSAEHSMTSSLNKKLSEAEDHYVAKGFLTVTHVVNWHDSQLMHPHITGEGQLQSAY